VTGKGIWKAGAAALLLLAASYSTVPTFAQEQGCGGGYIRGCGGDLARPVLNC